MAKIQLKRGLSTNLDTLTVKDGQLLFCTDTGRISLDYVPAGEDTAVRINLYEADFNTIKTLVGDKTVAQQIKDAIDKLADIYATIDDVTEVDGKITTLTTQVNANKDAIDILNGEATEEGSVAKQVADAVARIVADAPEAYDTLVEISNWIADHADDASAMNTAIIDNKNAITKLNADSETTGSVDYKIAQAISALDTLDEEEDNQYVSAVSQIDGTIVVTRKDLPEVQIEWGTF